jgi:hypothetical protein
VDDGPFLGRRPHARELPPHSREAMHRRGRHGRPYHPAPGIVVDVPEAQGASAAVLQRAARNLGYWPFRRCYEDGLRHDQRLAGKVSLDLSIAADGAVRSAVTAADLSDESVIRCVAREVQQLSLGVFDGESHARVEVKLWTGDEPLPVAPPVPRADEVQQALRASWPAVEDCYAAALAKRPDAGGSIDLRFRVAFDGAVLDVAEEGDPRFGDVEVTQCVLDVYRSARLPARRSGSQETRFGYAIHLEAAPL